MTNNEIRIVVNAPAAKAFEFTLEPKNKKMWMEDFAGETVSPDQIKLGTFYINSLGKLEVTDYEKDVFIELTHTENSYQSSYSFRKINEAQTEIVYFEAMFDGSELTHPRKHSDFETLKTLLES